MRRLDLPGVGLGSVGLLGLGWGLVRVGDDGWTNPEVLAALAGAVLALVSFVTWELRAAAPMLPMRFFRNRAFAVANLTAMFMYAALFGGLFMVTQLLQTGLGAAPLGAGLRLLPMAVMPMLLAPVGGALADRLGARPLMILGVSMVTGGLAWLAAVAGPDVGYGVLVPSLVLTGAGSAVFFAPLGATVLGAVAPHEQGQASGVATSVRELGAVVGVAVLASMFAAHGDLDSPARFAAGVVPAFWVAAALGATGVLAALVLPRPRVASPAADIERHTEVAVPR
jgi:MFS family permease